MRFVLLYHSLVSDWNHGNAHFLRGVVAELLDRGHDVDVLEPADGWSRRNLLAEQGGEAVAGFERAFPNLRSRTYRRGRDVEEALEGADVAVVHEWNEPSIVRLVGRRRARDGGFRLLFHDTHHRMVTAPEEMERYDLRHYDGVLAFGRVITELYLERGWAARAWTWHEAADPRVFRPLRPPKQRDDVVWIGNWGDGERSRELRTFLLEPVERLGLTGSVHGVRYPPHARRAVSRAGLTYRGWIANHHVPRVFAAHRVTVHVPRRPYARALPGIPTIRVFEALACGVPLVTAPWDDAEGLFSPGRDYLVADDGEEMTRLLKEVTNDADVAASLRRHGLRTIAARHTCAHRVDELLVICRELDAG